MPTRVGYSEEGQVIKPNQEAEMKVKIGDNIVECESVSQYVWSGWVHPQFTQTQLGALVMSVADTNGEIQNEYGDMTPLLAYAVPSRGGLITVEGLPFEPVDEMVQS